jgi:putative ABC transport system permease protein
MIGSWVRASARRPRRAVTTVLVLAVLTLATTASLLAGDALAQLFRDDALAEWGEVDVEARSLQGPFLSDGAARLLTVEAGSGVRAGAPRLELPAVARAGDRREPQARVLGLGAEEADFAALQAIEGDAGVGTLSKGEAVVNARLAERLGLRVADRLELVVAVPQWHERVPGREAPLRRPAQAVPLALVVAGVVSDTGVADLHRTANVLVRREVLQEAAGLSPAQSTSLHLDVRTEGRDAAEDVVRAVTPTAQRLGIGLAPVKADALDLADEEGGLFRSLLLSLALLVLLAATAAAVELLTALGLERSAELTLLRALGLRDRVAGRLLVAEAALYAGAGAVLGLALSVPAGHALARGLSDHFAGLESGRGREQVALDPELGPLPFVVGALVVLGAAVLAARASARRLLGADLDSALRGAPGLRAGGPTRWPVVLLAAGAWLVGAGTTASSGSGALLYLGITLLLCAWWLRARGRADRPRRADARAALAALVWSLGGAALLGDFSAGVQAGFGVLVVAGVVAVAASAVLLATRLRSLGQQLRSVLPRGRAQVWTLLASAEAHAARDRSALRMCVVGGALFMAAALTVLGSAQSLDADRQSGGFDAVGTAVVGVDAGQLERLPPVADVVAVPHTVLPEAAYRTQRDDGPLAGVPYPVRLAGITTSLVGAQRFGLADALPEHATAGDALAAALRDEDKAVVDRYALPEGAQVGDDVVLVLRGVERRFTLAAVLDTYLLNTVLIGGRSFDELAARSGDTLVLARAADDASRPQLVAALDEAGWETGLDVRTVDRLRADVVAVNRTFTDVFALMLLLALVVVVVSIGAATTRAARQRRAELGLLRALGARRTTVVLALALEPVLASALGALVGLAAGLVVLRALFALGYSSLAFVLDVERLVAVVAGTLLLVLVTALLAAWSAARGDVGTELADLG